MAVLGALALGLLVLPSPASAALRLDDLDLVEGDFMRMVDVTYRDDAAVVPQLWRCADFKAINGTATVGSDVRPLFSNVGCIPPGQRTQSFPIEIWGERAPEHDEQLFLEISHGRSTVDRPGIPGQTPQPYPITDGQGTITLRNDDGSPLPDERFVVNYIAGLHSDDGVSGSYQCIYRTAGNCPAGSEPPLTLRLERGGQVIGSANGKGVATLKVRPQAGDVARISVDGADRVAHTWDGRPEIDTSCSRVGRRTVSGRVSPGHTVSGGSSAGDTFTQTTSSPLRHGQVVFVSSTGTQTISPQVTLTVRSTVASQICGPRTCLVQQKERLGPYSTLSRSSLSIAAALRSVGFRELVRGRFESRPFACRKGRIEVRFTVRRRGKWLVVAKGSRQLDRPGASLIGATVRWKATRAGRARLRGARRIVGRVTVRQVDAAGATASHTRKVVVTGRGKPG
jgi:hypothetical protein